MGWTGMDFRFSGKKKHKYDAQMHLRLPGLSSSLTGQVHF